ncbi:Hypothetical predicted protein, partial [Paramuricea clavata]
MASPHGTIESTYADMTTNTIKSLSSSLRSYKGHLSRVINVSRKAVTDFLDTQDPSSIAERKDEIKKYIRRIETTVIALQEMDPANIAKYDIELTKEEERANEAIHELMKAAVSRRPTEDRSGQPSRSHRINESLKPAILSKDASPKQQRSGQPFTDYMAKLKELSKLADLDKLSVEEIFVFCALRGTVDKDLLDDFLELPNKTLKAIEETASLYESKIYSKAKLNAPVDSPVLKIYPPPSKRQGSKGNPRRDRPNASSNTNANSNSSS